MAIDLLTIIQKMYRGPSNPIPPYEILEEVKKQGVEMYSNSLDVHLPWL